MANKTIELRATTNLNKWPVEKKKMALGEIFVSTPQIKSILTKIERCHHQSKYYGAPQNCYIIGEPGLGKSLICKYYRSQYPAYDEINPHLITRIIPVLYSKIPILATAKSLPTALLFSMGYPFYNSGNEQTKTDRLKDLIITCKTELLLLDEAQHIKDRDSHNILYAATNWLKSFIEDTGLPTILVGLPDLKTVIKSNEQLRDRFNPNDNCLLPFNIDDIVPHLSLGRFLSMVDMKLPFPNPSYLDAPLLAEIIFLASSGVPRLFMEQIIIPCSIDAIDRELPSIPHELIKKQAEQLAKDRGLKAEFSKISKINVGSKKSRKARDAVNS